MALNDDADDTPDSQPPLVRTVSFSLVMTSETETVLPRGGCESGVVCTLMPLIVESRRPISVQNTPEEERSRSLY